MKNYTCCFLLFFTFHTNCFSQQLKKYVGDYSLFGSSSVVNYTYYEDENLNRIYEGKYFLQVNEFWVPDRIYYTISGVFNNNLKNGIWTLTYNGQTYISNDLTTKISEKYTVTGNFKKSVRNGIWKDTRGLQVEFNNDSIVGNIKFNGLNINISKNLINGTFKSKSGNFEEEVKFLKGYLYYTLSKQVDNGRIIKKEIIDTNIVNSCVKNIDRSDKNLSYTYTMNKEFNGNVIGYSEYNGKYYRIEKVSIHYFLKKVNDLATTFDQERGSTDFNLPEVYGIFEDSLYGNAKEKLKNSEINKKSDSLNLLNINLFYDFKNTGDKHYKNKELQDAVFFYKRALLVNFNSQWKENSRENIIIKIDEIDSKIIEYKTLTIEGDSAMILQRYSSAVNYYLRANEIYPCEEIQTKLSYSKQQQIKSFEQKRLVLSDSLKQLVIKSLILVDVEGGNYKSNCDKKFDDIIVNNFKMSAFEITNYQFMLFLMINDKTTEYDTSKYKNMLNSLVRNNPATTSYEYAIAFCNWVGADLPTEYEWEFAASGGVKHKNYAYAGSNSPESIANYYSAGGRFTNIGSYKPNTLGIYDMTGNVSEYIKDNTTYTKGGNVESIPMKEYYTICSKIPINNNSTFKPFGFRLIFKE